MLPYEYFVWLKENSTSINESNPSAILMLWSPYRGRVLGWRYFLKEKRLRTKKGNSLTLLNPQLPFKRIDDPPKLTDDQTHHMINEIFRKYNSLVRTYSRS